MKKVLISCPGDVRPYIGEINRAIDTFNTFNACLGFPSDIMLISMYYGKNDYPISGGPPQDIINREFADSADYLICVFWARFGTPTGNYKSGTEEELEEHIKNGKPASLFYIDDPIPPSQSDCKQLSLLRNFRKKHEKTILSKLTLSKDLFGDVFSTLVKFYLKLDNITTIHKLEDRVDIIINEDIRQDI